MDQRNRYYDSYKELRFIAMIPTESCTFMGGNISGDISRDISGDISGDISRNISRDISGDPDRNTIKGTVSDGSDSYVTDAYDKNPNVFTLYFYEKESQAVLPIRADAVFAEKFLASYEKEKVTDSLNPSLFNTVTRIIRALQGYIESITIYKNDSGNFYCYLNISTNENEQIFSVNCSFWDALILGKIFSARVLIDTAVLNLEGIKITKKLLKDALDSEKYTDENYDFG